MDRGERSEAAVLEFGRVASTELLDAARANGRFDLLVRRAAQHPGADVQLRRDGSVIAATLYMGLTAALTLQERDGRFRLDTHATHRAAAAFAHEWAEWRPLAALASQAEAVDKFLDRLLSDGGIDPRWITKEGIVQAALSRRGHAGFGIVQREAEVWSKPPTLVADTTIRIADRMWAAVQGSGRSDAWWPGVRDRGQRPRMGRSVDLLGFDSAGRLAVIEVKPATATSTIPWAAAQVGLYAELFAAWWHSNPSARQQMRVMAEQRHSLGLLDEQWCQIDTTNVRVVPIVAIGGGSPTSIVLARLKAIAEVLATVAVDGPGAELLDPLEVWLCADDGTPSRMEASPVISDLPSAVRMRTSGARSG